MLPIPRYRQPNGGRKHTLSRPPVFSLFLFSLIQIHIGYMMSHIFIGRTDNLSCVYQLLDAVRAPA